MEGTEEIDTANISIVGAMGDTVTVMLPRQRMTKAEALNTAAYLVLCAGDYDGEQFKRVFEAVRSA